jgi:hypothetical protein
MELGFMMKLTVYTFGLPGCRKKLGPCRVGFVERGKLPGFFELNGRGASNVLLHGFVSLDMKVLSIVLLSTVFAACTTASDYTKNQSDVCAVHHQKMTKRTVPIAYGMIPMSRTNQPESWKRRVREYPNAGDCMPATDISMGEKNAVVFVCPRCEEAYRKAKAAGVEGR